MTSWQKSWSATLETQARPLWRAGSCVGTLVHLLAAVALQMQDARVRLVHADALDADLQQLTLASGTVKVVANVPFNITTGQATHAAQLCWQPEAASADACALEQTF